jgi:hypothetical protein
MVPTMDCDLAHGKLVNVRNEQVRHEFVNTHWRHVDRILFQVDVARWDATLPGAAHLEEFLTALLCDLGTGLETPLYEEAVTHCFGGKSAVEVDEDVHVGGRCVGHQRVRLIAPGVALKITGFEKQADGFELHARRLLAHTDLRAIAWVNINIKQVTFITLE